MSSDSLPGGLRIQNIGIAGANEIQSAFAAATRERAEALVVIDDVVISSRRAPIVELASEGRLPVISTYKDFADAEGLLAYGPSAPDMYQRCAYFIDRILTGAKPADLPVEKPTTFELVINLRTAKALGLTIPPSLLQRAD